LKAVAIFADRPGSTILPDTTSFARAGEKQANTTTYSAYLNQLHNRQGSITVIAWLSKAPLYAEVYVSEPTIYFAIDTRLAENYLTDSPLTEAESFGT
jgi:hypothetical protein